MLISGIRSYENIYNTKITDRVNAPEQAAGINSTSVQKPVSRDVENFDLEQNTEVKRDFKNSDNFADRYTPGATYEMKGSMSDVNKLDVTPSLSDNMRKQIFTQYEMFVGNASGTMVQSPQASSVRPTEDFTV